jgi:hypothetical protein
MPLRNQRQDDADLRRLSRVKGGPPPLGAGLLGPEMVGFFKKSVQKRHPKLGAIAECWARLVPDLLNDHCALESFSRGTLVVIVDSSSHLYQLKTLLLAGLQQQLLVACASAGLKKISLTLGRWYDDAGDDAERGGRRIRFGE